MAAELRIGLAELLRKAKMEHNADLLKEASGCSPKPSWRYS